MFPKPTGSGLRFCLISCAIDLEKITLILLFDLMAVSKTDTTEFYSLRIESMLCMQIKHGCKEEDNNYDRLARKTLLLLVRGFLCKWGRRLRKVGASGRGQATGEVKRQLTLWCEESPDNSSDQDRDWDIKFYGVYIFPASCNGKDFGGKIKCIFIGNDRDWR